MTAAGHLLRPVDRAAFVAGLGATLRRRGLPLSISAMATFSRALEASPPRDVRTLYWTARITLVGRHDDLETFDSVFDAVFRDAALPLEGQRGAPASTGSPSDLLAGVDGAAGPAVDGEGLPWHTLPPAVSPADDSPDGPVVPERLPSAIAGLHDIPFDDLDEAQLALVGSWLEGVLPRWPTRVSRRRRPHPHGDRVALRETIARSRRTGWEPVTLVRTRVVRRPRPVVVIADVSQSMQPYTTAYLHLLRALALGGRAEAFVFSTGLTRVTAALRHRSAEEAVAGATRLAEDRYGGTHLASSLRALLRSRHGHALRGGIVVIASDGCDADEPQALAEVMRRVHRRAHRVVWVNPRAAAPGFEPLVGSMAAALPWCDAFLPGDTLTALQAVVEAVVAP
ncbi:MAG: VWA domain-containing protein [Actinomycetota bacterium]|nr:VWA domain-containing protein [Actinomycetota bacterium]